MMELSASEPIAADSELLACERLLALHLDAATRRFGSVALGVIDLPALGNEVLIPAHLRVAAVLFWCWELERAGLLPFMEALATSVERGEDGLVLGMNAQLLVPFGRRGAERMNATERNACYAQLFARDRAGFEFEGMLRSLLRSLDGIARASWRESVLPQRVRVATQALELGRELSARAVGMAAFVARDVVAQIREALAVLRDPSLARALGGGAPAQLVQRHGPRLLGRPLRYHHHQQRAGAGVVILSWIAQEAADLHAAARGLTPTHQIVMAAQVMLVGEGGAA